MLMSGSLRPPIATERAVTKNGHGVRVGRRWRRGTVVREHRCPPARFWFARPSQSTPLPSGFTHAHPPMKTGNASSSGMNYRTGEEKSESGCPRTRVNPTQHENTLLLALPRCDGRGQWCASFPIPPSRATRRLRGSGVRRGRRVRSPRVVQRPRTRPRTAQ